MLTLDIEKIKRINKNLLLLHESNEEEALVAEATLQLIYNYEKLMKRIASHDKNAPDDCGPVGLDYE